jgi:prolyl 4-hydroxylase
MSQTITPQLREWIVSQAQAGFTADVVLKSMLDSGWQEEVAIEAMESTLRDHLQKTQPDQLLPPALAVPVPAVLDAPLYIDAGDRRVSVLSVISEPHIVVFGNVLSDEECEALIEGAKPRLARSLTVETKTGGEELNADRTSNGMFYARAENELIARVERRLAQLVNWPLDNGEGLQILHYRPGAEYKPTILKRGGQRVATVIMYLHEPEKGGGTVFPDVKLEVAPKRGNAVFFSYSRPHPASKSLHGGAPVIAGEKWIATKWLREGKFA